MNTNNNNIPSGVGSGPRITANDLKTFKTLSCEKCSGEIFMEGVMIKIVSSLMTGNGKEGMIPIPAIYCVKCQQIVEKYLPDELKGGVSKITL
jgi:hypothetical protein